jgi:hypothetical protein
MTNALRSSRNLRGSAHGRQRLDRRCDWACSSNTAILPPAVDGCLGTRIRGSVSAPPDSSCVRTCNLLILPADPRRWHASAQALTFSKGLSRVLMSGAHLLAPVPPGGNARNNEQDCAPEHRKPGSGDSAAHRWRIHPKARVGAPHGNGCRQTRDYPMIPDLRNGGG